MGCTSSTPKVEKKTTEGKSVSLKKEISNANSKLSNKSSSGDRLNRVSGLENEESLILKKMKAHRAVFTKGFDAGETNLLRTPVEKSAEEIRWIVESLGSCYLFATASDEQREELAKYMWKEVIDPDTTVLKQGEPGDKFYAIQSGTFDFFVDGKKVTRRSPIAKESYFGELALLYDSPRQASAICVSGKNIPEGQEKEFEEEKTKATLWAIDRDTFRHILASTTKQTREQKKNAVLSIPLLRNALTEEQLNKVIECIQLFHFRTGQRIVRKGDKGDVCFFIKEGTVECSKIGESGLGVVQLGEGSYFGERALVKDEPRAADVIALTDVVAMALDRKSFTELLGPLRGVMDDNMKERVMESLPILKELPLTVREEVINEFELETFNKGEVIVLAGDVNADKFYVVRQGNVNVLEKDTGNILAVLSEGDWFGEMALLTDEPRVATCVAKERVECFVLQRNIFNRIKENSKVLLQTSAMRRASNAKSKELFLKEKLKQIKLSELDRIKILGKGTFGTVFLCCVKEKDKSKEEERESKYFALKSMNKYNLVKCEQKTNVVNEKKILEECDHPFILQLINTYQDRDNVYMLLEFVQGGELFSIMQQKHKFPLYPTCFYSACIVDIFEYLHSHAIVYRDLKPENVLIDRFGYVKLVDFGFSKKVTDRTFTLCGTPEYLAPEVVLCRGHNKCVDYWAIGILIFEMLVGMSPFADEYDDDQKTVCTNIVKGKIPFDKLARALADTESKPDNFWKTPSLHKNGTNGSSNSLLDGKDKKLSKQHSTSIALPVEDLIRKLLNKSPSARLGNNGAKEVKRHLFYSSEIDDWEDLRLKKVLAPYVPSLQSESDTSFFDEFEPDRGLPQYKGDQSWCAEF